MGLPILLSLAVCLLWAMLALFGPWLPIAPDDIALTKILTPPAGMSGWATMILGVRSPTA